MDECYPYDNTAKFIPAPQTKRSKVLFPGSAALRAYKVLRSLTDFLLLGFAKKIPIQKNARLRRNQLAGVENV